MAQQGNSWPGRRGEAMLVASICGIVYHGEAGMVRQGIVWRIKASRGWAGSAELGDAGSGSARHKLGKAGTTWPSGSWSGSARIGRAMLG